MEDRKEKEGRSLVWYVQIYVIESTQTRWEDNDDNYKYMFIQFWKEKAPIYISFVVIVLFISENKCQLIFLKFIMSGSIDIPAVVLAHYQQQSYCLQLLW